MQLVEEDGQHRYCRKTHHTNSKYAKKSGKIKMASSVEIALSAKPWNFPKSELLRQYRIERAAIT